jgi:serine/threonine protein kinase
VRERPRLHALGDGDDGLLTDLVSSPAVLGQIVGKYRIVEPIAEGGMGMVYRAEHTVLGSPAAVKILLPQFTVDPTVVDRFFTEAKATSAIRHVGIVEVFDFGMLPGRSAYIAMELLRGESLGDHLDRRTMLAPAMAVNVATQMLAALDAAHVIGVVHRDLKPDNVYLLPDAGAPGGVRIKILDFGIAKLVSDTVGAQAVGPREKTRAGTILGTPAYMAPEQCRGGGEIDHRADLYAVGCILFEMLTGRQPFVATGGGEVMAMHIYEPPPRLRDLAPALPSELDQLMQKFLTKASADRPPSAAWALAALERVPLGPLGPPESGMFASTSGGHFAVTATGPVRSANQGTPAPRVRHGSDGMPGWVPVVLFGVALVIAIVAVILIGRSGDGLDTRPVEPAKERPQVTPIESGSAAPSAPATPPR